MDTSEDNSAFDKENCKEFGTLPCLSFLPANNAGVNTGRIFFPDLHFADIFIFAGNLKPVE